MHLVALYSNFVLQTDSAEAAVDICPERMDAVDAAVLTMSRFFWRTRRKSKQKQEAVDEC